MASKGDKPAGGGERVKRVTKRRTGAQTVSATEVGRKGRGGARGAGHGFLLSGRARKTDVTAFLRQLVMLLDAGTPILKSLKTLAERGSRAGIRALVGDIAEYVEAGNPLWQAFERHPAHFDTIFVNMIKASEASGTLTTVLTRQVEYQERREQLRKRVKGALAYPVVLLFVCAVVIGVIVKIVIPQFEDLFRKLDVQTHWFTDYFIAVSKWIGGWGGIEIIVAIIALVILYKLVTRRPLWRLKADRIKFFLPVIGNIVQKNAVVEFTRTLSLLLGSGLPMMATLELVRSAIRNKAAANVIQDLRDAVERGEGIEGPLRAVPGIIPPVVTDMLVTGEESGQLDKIGDQIAAVYEDDVRIAINALGDLLQPILTVFIGALVLLLAMALFVPMVQMIQQLSEGASGRGNV